MLPRISVSAVLLAALTIASCGGESPDSPAGGDASAESAEPVTPTFMVFVERTDDVAAWNARYESRAEARAEHGMSEVLSAVDLDSAGTVMVIQNVQELERVSDYLASEAAVLGTDPDESTAEAVGREAVYRMIEIGDMPERPVALVVIRSRVDAFDAWRAEFERAAAVRSEAGIHVAGIGRGLENDANLLQAYFATDLEAARRWAEGKPEDKPAESIRFVDPIN